MSLNLFQKADFENRQVLIQIKKKVFEQINLDRKNHGLKPVLYDKLAAQVGEEHCKEMLNNKYISHWNIQGYKPYHRYSFYGGRDSVSENCSSVDGSYPSFVIVDKVIEAALDSHLRMLSEVPPDDGHRKNILDPYHTHVGIGIAANEFGFRMTQEFIKHYVVVNISFPSRLTDKIELAGRILLDEFKFKSIAVFYEPLVKPLTVSDLKQTSSYSLPNDAEYEYPELPRNQFYTNGNKGVIKVKENGSVFLCQLELKKKLPGIYTIGVWIENESGKAVLATNISFVVKK